MGTIIIDCVQKPAKVNLFFDLRRRKFSTTMEMVDTVVNVYEKNEIEILEDEFSAGIIPISADLGEVVNYSTIVEVQTEGEQLKEVPAKAGQRQGTEMSLSTCVVYRLLLVVVMGPISCAVLLGALHRHNLV